MDDHNVLQVRSAQAYNLLVNLTSDKTTKHCFLFLLLLTQYWFLHVGQGLVQFLSHHCYVVLIYPNQLIIYYHMKKGMMAWTKCVMALTVYGLLPML